MASPGLLNDQFESHRRCRFGRLFWVAGAFEFSPFLERTICRRDARKKSVVQRPSPGPAFSYLAGQLSSVFERSHDSRDRRDNDESRQCPE